MPDLCTRSRSNAPASCGASHFQASVNGQPLLLSSLLGRLTLRPELSQAANHWIWKIIADGKVGHKRTSIGLFFDHDLEPGTYPLVGNERIKVVYNETPHWRSVIYHSVHLQSGTFTLLSVDRPRKQVQGQFGFGISAIDFEVSDGRFDLCCE